MGIFGSKDNQPATTDNTAIAHPAPAPILDPVPAQPVAPTVAAPIVPTPAMPPQPAAPAPPTDQYIMTPTPEPAITPAHPTNPAPAPVISAPSVPVVPDPVEPVAAAPVATDPLAEPSAVIPATDTQGKDDLSTLKQQALQQLSPLVNHLDQSPEERFQTTMMMLQATDDQSLIQEAYDAAQAITDEKARAQALLDVINEINYFTQHKG